MNPLGPDGLPMRLRGACLFTVVTCAFAAGSSCDTVDTSCENYLTALLAWEAACIHPGGALLLPTVYPLYDPTTDGLFVQRCEALSTAAGVSNLDAQLDVCTARLRAATSCGDWSALTCLVQGTLDDGSACASDAQCTGGHCINVDTTANPTTETLCGICATDVAVGGSCKGGFCEPATGACVGNVCVAFVERGGACDSGQPCDVALQCDSATKTCEPSPTLGAPCTQFCQIPYACIGGTCAPQVASGGTCTDWSQCQPSLQCDSQSSTCVAVPPALAGEACGWVNGLSVECASGLTCSNRICVGAKPAGASCTVGNFECAPGLSCTNNTCQLPLASNCHP